MAYQILFSDLDGTLLRPDMTVNPADWDAIRQMAKEGIPFVPCTGRVHSEIPEELRNESAIRYYISANGAVTYDKETDTRTVRGISNRLLQEVLAVLNAHSALYYIRHNSRTYSDATRHTAAEYATHGVHDYDRDFLEVRAIRQADYAAFANDLEDTEMICAFFTCVEDTLAAKAELEKGGEIYAANSYDTLLEIFHKDAGKGNAILQLASSLGIAPEAVIAVGDTGNDISAVQAAGLGLAVENATDSLKAVADAVICKNTEAPVTYIYEHYFKGDHHAEV